MGWKKALEEDEFIGGDLEFRVDLQVFRGPIKKIKFTDEYVYFMLEWAAEMELVDSEEDLVWIYRGPMEFRVNHNVPLRGDYDGKLIFAFLPCSNIVGLGIIFPADGDKLDPDNVNGFVVKLPKTNKDGGVN